MIPILYDKNEIAFVSNGLGRLVDCVSCDVTEERNGVYECEFVYPMTGRFYQEMVENGGIISVIHDDAKDRQAFDIYKYSAPIDGLVTFNARHISYRLSGIPVRPFTAASCALALQGIKDNSVMPNPFTFWTDKVVSSTFTLDVPASARALLAGQQGSILDVYGKGEYKFNNFDVRLYVNRGVDSGVEIRYGKNLSNMTRENDKGDLYNAIVPYWKGESGVVTVPGYIVTAAGQTAKKCVPMDFSGEFSEEPTATQLQAAAENYLAENEPWAAFDNITVDFVQLWETEDYKDVAVLERCSLCDTVSVYFPALGVTNTHAKIIKVTYDVLRERYVSMELGSPQTTLSQAVLAPYQEAIDSIDEKASVSFLESAIQAATDLITGGLGGHVVIGRNADGEPNEILIMDTDDKATAVNVWRFNVNGLAHSHNGYNGPYSDIALTMDGKINADMITTGTLNAALANIINLNADNITSGALSADRIAGGILKIGNVNNTGAEIYLYDPYGVLSGMITYHGLSTKGTSNGQTVNSLVADGEIQLLQDGYGLAAILRMISSSPFLLFYYPGGRMAAAYGKDGLYYYFSDRDNHIAINLGQDATRSFLTLNSPDGSSDIFLDTLPANGSRFNSPTRFNAGATVSNGLTADNAIVNGVLDVTPRRCYATLSSSGWYRVITIAGSGGGIDSWIANICITRKYNISRNETHSISLLACDGSFSFVDEISKSNTQGISDIRYVRDGSYGYIDIYYSLSNENDVCVTFDVKTIPTRQENFVSSDFGSVAQTPSSGSVVAQHSFFPTTGSKIAFSPSVGTSFNDYGGCYYMIQNGICFVHVGLSGLSPNTPQVVFTLPSRVRPQSLIATCGIGGASVTAISRGWIYEDGRITIVPDDQYTAIDFSYVI